MKRDKLNSLDKISDSIKDIKVITPPYELKEKVDYKYILEFKADRYTIQAKVDDVETDGLVEMVWDGDDEESTLTLTDIKSMRVLCDDKELYEQLEQICEYIMSTKKVGEEDISCFGLPREYICLIDLIHTAVLLTCSRGLPATTELLMLTAYESGCYKIDELLSFTDMINNLLYKFELARMSVLSYSQEYDNPNEIYEMLLAYDAIKDSTESYMDKFYIDDDNLKSFIRTLLAEIYCIHDLYKVLTPDQYLAEVDKDFSVNKDEMFVEPLTFFTNALRSIAIRFDTCT